LKTPFADDVDDKKPAWQSRKSDFDKFLQTLNGLEATGGGDIAEDVLGALDQATNLDWCVYLCGCFYADLP
jgi:hypothetical protein